jgi:hypothetical protein
MEDEGRPESPVEKLSWSFRIGARLHSNPNIADIEHRVLSITASPCQ